MIDRPYAAEVALEAALEAAKVVMRVYETPFAVEYKVGDDPVTAADREANALLCDRLARAFPGVPIVAEESDPQTYAGFSGAPAVWFVDPLDGTREFVARSGEFSVMVGLAEAGRAVLGVVAAPAWDRAFVGIVGEGAWQTRAGGARTPIRVSSHATLAHASVVLSRSHRSARLDAFVASLGPREIGRHGSSGLKGVLVAEGKHDVYLQLGRAGMLWDACATEAVVVAAGGRCTDIEGRALGYAVEDLSVSRGLVATNGPLHAPVLEALEAARRA
jgi:3'(2'), 5'-bisphosphate nucleotidase